jgi:hypothetical protein
MNTCWEVGTHVQPSAYAYMHMFNVLDDDVGLRAVSPSVCGRVSSGCLRSWLERYRHIHTAGEGTGTRTLLACKYREVEAEA